MPFKFAIGFVLVFFACSTAFANEHNQIASKLMQTQNCSFDISSYNLTKDNVQALRTKQLETIRNVHQITKDAMDKLVQANPAFRTLDFALNSGLRFGRNFVTRPEDIQLGTGVLNYRKSINSTGDVLKRFGQALNKMVDDLQLANLLFGQQIGEQYPYLLAMQTNQIIDFTLIRMFRDDFRAASAFHPIATTVFNGFKFGPTFRGIGQFNWRKSFKDSMVELKRLADGLIGIATQWEAQLVQQKESCERYLQDTFVPVVEISSRSNTTVLVVGNNETMQANANSTTVSPISQIQSNLSSTVSPVPEVVSNLTTTVSPNSVVQSNLTSMVSPVSQIQSSQTSIVSPISQLLTNLTNISKQLNITQTQLVTQLLSTYNVTSFSRIN